MAEIKVDLINYCKVNMSSPNSCNSTNLNQNLSNNKNLKSSPSMNHPLNDIQNSNNTTNQSTNNHHFIQNKFDSESKAKFYANRQLNEQKKVYQSIENDQLDEPNEIIDQFNDFDHFDRKGSINEIPATLITNANNHKLIENQVTVEDIAQVLKAFQEKSSKLQEYRSKDEKIQFMCLSLFNYDYEPDELMIINNTDSDLSSSYPLKIIVPRTSAFPIDHERLRNLIMKAKYARCRCRFPIPVILFNNKYVCRSATLSHCIEIYSRQSYASFFKTGEEEQIQDIATEINEMNLDSLDLSPNFDVIDNNQEDIGNDKSSINNSKINKSSNGYFSALSFKQDYSQLVNEARAQDILLLNYLNVKHIIDLMVEMKKVKFGIYVASSEKADKLKRYRDFNINVLPYPGCEFFKFYRDNNYQAEDLIYDWNQAFVDADLNIFDNDVLNELKLEVDFNNYKKWDLNNLTLNYLKLILSYLVEPSNESILLHCISGWDRTSEFVSLVRLSLWADYELHPNLNYEQILYLTLGYDWYLFGHDLSDRVDKGEEIMHYCFYFLKFLSSTEYSIDYLRKNIVKKGDEYVRVKFNCCGNCKIEEQQQKAKNKIDETKLLVVELEDEINSSMYSSQASTVVNNNLRKEQLLNQFNGCTDDDESFSSNSPETPKNISFDSSGEDVVDNQDLSNSTISTKTFVVDPNFDQNDQNISASPSSFTTFKDLRNNNAIRDSNDLNKFDIISLDDQSLSSNSSYDVHAVNKQTNQHQMIQIQNGYNLLANKQQQQQQQSLSNNLISNHQSNNKQNNDTNNECNNENSNDLNCKDSFSCGSPPQLLSNTILPTNNCCEIADEEDILSSSGESNTLAAEDAIDSGDSCSTAINSNIQRSNAVAIPSRTNRQSNDTYNSSNNSNISNTSNRLSDQSFNLNRCDSWQIVSGTGSVKDKNFLSSTSLDEVKRNVNTKTNTTSSTPNQQTSSTTTQSNRIKQNHFAHNYVPTCCCKSLNCGKYCEKIDKFNKENDLEKFIYTRKKRLSDVRVVFYQCYSKYIGLSTANGLGGGKFSSFVEKIKYPFRTGVGFNGLTRNGPNRLSQNRKSTQSFQSYIEDVTGDSLDLNDRNENSNTNK